MTQILLLWSCCSLTELSFFSLTEFSFFSRNFLLFHTECTECTDFYLPQIAQIEKIFYLPDLTIRSLAAQEVALEISTDFTPSELLFHTEVFFFSHGMHGYHGIYASRAFRI